MGLTAAREIFRIDADELGAEGGGLTQGTRHDSKQASAAERDDGSQELARAADREIDHGLPDDRNASLVRQALRHFGPLNHAHAVNSPRPTDSPRRPWP